MRMDAGWSLVELLVVIGIVALLMAILVPAVEHVRDMARLMTCAAGLHDLGIAVASYGAGNSQSMPPFAFSSAAHPDLPLSGHWGGASQVGDPAAFGRRGVNWVNLWALVKEGQTAAAALICPAAPAELQTGQASYFPNTLRYSTYCLRFPPSTDLFTDAPMTGDRYGIGIYKLAAGGQPSPVRAPDSFGVMAPETVPQMRLDRTYRLLDKAACGDGEYDVAADAMLADGFWQPGAAAGAAGTYRIVFGRCHGERFNVLYGRGAVRTIVDDGTVAAGASAGGSCDDGAYFGGYAERIWQFFDGR